MNFEGYTDDEVRRWLWLRAMEWDAFPAYISQPIAPILFIFYPWYLVLLAVLCIGLIWCLIRYPSKPSFVGKTRSGRRN